jgi:mannosyltransferase
VAWRDALIGYGAIAVLYLPWVPTVLYQAAHTGAPWSNAPTLGSLPSALAAAAGGTGPGVALLLVGGSGVAAYWTMRRGPVGPPTQQSATVTAFGAAIIIAIALAFIASQISPGWTLRYFAAVIGPLILLSGGVLARAGNLGLVTVALLAGLWLHPPTGAVNGKSNVHAVAALYADYFHPGDVVVSTHPEQTPVAHFYFPDHLRWASAMGGWWPDTGIMDWRDVLQRYRDARVPATATKLISALRPGQQLILILPVLRTANWNAPWTHLVKRRSIQWHRYLNHAPRLEREHQVPHLSRKRLPHGIRVVLYRRVSARS